MPIFWDDLGILRALDELEGESRAYNGSGEDLLKKAAGDRLIGDEDRAAFSRLLIMLASQGRVTFEQHASGARVLQHTSASFRNRCGTSSSAILVAIELALGSSMRTFPTPTRMTAARSRALSSTALPILSQSITRLSSSRSFCTTPD
jgi:hypothetical protein